MFVLYIHIHVYIYIYMCVHTTSSNSMDLSLSWEATSRSPAKGFLNILYNPKVHYRVHKRPPLVPNPSQISPVQSIPPHRLSQILYILFCDLRLGLSSGLFPSSLPTKIVYAFLFVIMRATCPANIVLLYVITLIILDKECIYIHQYNYGNTYIHIFVETIKG
jgi:hypothetical protein